MRNGGDRAAGRPHGLRGDQARQLLCAREVRKLADVRRLLAKVALCFCLACVGHLLVCGEVRAAPAWQVPPDTALLYEFEEGASFFLPKGVMQRYVHAADVTLDHAIVNQQPVVSYDGLEDVFWFFLTQLPATGPAGNYEQVLVFPNTGYAEYVSSPSVLHARDVGVVRNESDGAMLERRVELRSANWVRGGAREGVLSVGSRYRHGVLTEAKATWKGTFTTRVNEVPSRIQVKLRAIERELSTHLPRRCQEAVNRGLDGCLVSYLKDKRYLKKSPFYRLGYLSLNLYAALRAGMAPDHPVCKRALSDLARLPRTATYSVALAIMCVEAACFERVETEQATLPRFRQGAPNASTMSLIKSLTATLLAMRKADSLWSYGSRGEDSALASYDLSNTQFALLALHAAQRSGVHIDVAVWQEIAQALLSRQATAGPVVEIVARQTPRQYGSALWQQPEGQVHVFAGTPIRARGFGYNKPGRAYPYRSMTAGGVSSLAIALGAYRRYLPDDTVTQVLNGALTDGVAWLQAHWHSRNARDRDSDYAEGTYVLYSEEKAFALTDIVSVGGHNWWQEGALELLLAQRPQGHWGTKVESSTGVPDSTATALAVLFLTRATAEPELAFDALIRPTTGDGKQRDPYLGVVDGRGSVDMRQLATAVLVRNEQIRRRRLAWFVKALGTMDEDDRPLLLPALAEHMRAPFDDVKRHARKAVERIVGYRISDPQKILAIGEQWQQIRALEQPTATADIQQLGTIIATERSALLVRAAVAVVLKRKFDAVVDTIIDRLEASDNTSERRFLHNALVAYVGRDPGYAATGSAKERARGVALWRQAWGEAQRDGRKQRP